MGLETGTYISDLVATNPVTGDGVNQGDDHLKLLKSTVKNTFPNITGAVTPTHTELNYVDGVTSAIQTQLDAKAPLASPTFTGTVVLPATTNIDTVSATELSYLNGVTSALQTQLDAKVDDSTFPNVSGAVTPTHTELNFVDGVTSAIQTQLDAKAPLASPALTGVPTAPTAATTTNTTQVATTAFVQQEIAAIPAADLGGTTLLGTITTTSGTSANLGSLTLTDYKFLRLVWNNVSHNAGGGSTYLIGNTTSDDVQCTETEANGNILGVMDIDLATGIGFFSYAYVGTSRTPYVFDSAITTASTQVTVATGGATLDNGSIRVYGIK